MANEDQVGNVSQEEAPESMPVQNTDGTGDFFESLEQGVNSLVYDDKTTEAEQLTSLPQDNTILGESPEEATNGEVETLKKRYSDSSREAKKMHNRLGELEPYVPILEAMREDPNLITHVRNYFEGGGQTPANMKEHLGLDEEFVFDPDEAVSNPESDSGRVLGATIDGVVQKRLNDTLSRQKADNVKLTRESEFRNKHSLTNDEWERFVDFAKNKTLELEDILYLQNRGAREKNIARSEQQQVSKQMQKTRTKPQSLATTGSSQVESSPEDSVFDTLLGIDQTLEQAFGG
tara:strand:+ start:2203 stop:3075 length:873 start_codon:yes stop_codon:yes gene_type:complete